MVVRAVLTTLIFITACSVGEVPIGGGAGPDGNNDGTGGGMSFNMIVKPLVTECVACHSTTQPPNLTSYMALEAKYKSKPGSGNLLVTKGSLTAGTHQGIPYLSTGEQTAVAGWIDGL
jgi:hypothetical protein